MSESKLVESQENAFCNYYYANKYATECYDAIRELTHEDAAITELLDALERYLADRTEAECTLKRVGLEEHEIYEIAKEKYGNK